MLGYFNAKELARNPVVDMVDANHLTLKTEFRIRLFTVWKKTQSLGSLSSVLEANGITKELVGNGFTQTLADGFKLNGYPCRTVSETYGSREPEGTDSENPLVSSGKFIQSRNGIKITPDFKDELYQAWPSLPVRDAIRSAGLDPADVGEQRINALKREFECREKKKGRQQPKAADAGKGTAENEKPAEAAGNAAGPVDSVEQVKPAVPKAPELSMEQEPGTGPWENPYVYQTGGRPTLRDAFFNETCFLAEKPVEELLEMYGIPAGTLTGAEKQRVQNRLRRWHGTADRVCWDDEKVQEIQRRRAAAMDESVTEGFLRMGGRLKGMGVPVRRKYCERIRELPRDPWGHYTINRILGLSGIARSTYYAILSDGNYGAGERRRRDKDEEDTAAIREVLGYQGFRKGIRQVYMMMPDITGKRLSINRIRKLMVRSGIRTNIRRPSKNRKAMKELFERNQKANLLMRRFKQHRPNEVRLTDVTYLDYGDGLRAYGSASVDPVTGKLACFVVSGTNDLQLALDTLKALDVEHLESGAILHSDQGILYMTDAFQAAARDLGFEQSMSRRGNCWDNAPQESFFGHFKDECPYEKCGTLEELRDKVNEYSVYYNTKRRMWDHGCMTPEEYEAYLLSMDEEGFGKYLAEEEARYRKRQEDAARQSVERARAYKNKGKEEEMKHGERGE